MKSRNRLVPMTLLALFSLSCFDPVEDEVPRALDEGCELSAQCAQGLSCLDPDDYFAATDDSGCEATRYERPSFCSLACASDSDCAQVGGRCRRFGCDSGQPGLCSAVFEGGIWRHPDGGMLPHHDAPPDAGSPVEPADAG